MAARTGMFRDSNVDICDYLPGEDVIAAEAAKIRATWSPTQLRTRRGWAEQNALEIPVIKLEDLGLTES